MDLDGARIDKILVVPRQREALENNEETG
jgi:hypothetical protein